MTAIFQFELLKLHCLMVFDLQKLILNIEFNKEDVKTCLTQKKSSTAKLKEFRETSSRILPLTSGRLSAAGTLSWYTKSLSFLAAWYLENKYGIYCKVPKVWANSVDLEQTAP